MTLNISLCCYIPNHQEFLCQIPGKFKLTYSFIRLKINFIKSMAAACKAHHQGFLNIPILSLLTTPIIFQLINLKFQTQVFQSVIQNIMVPLHISHHTFHMQPHLPVFYEVKCITNVHIPLYDIISSFIIRIPFKSKTNNKKIILL